MDTPSPDTLKNLIAAGLVSHEMIGDPGRLNGETAALRVLCGLVAGPVYRIEAYHYAFPLTETDLDGALVGMDAGARGEALAARLAAELGEGAVWLNSTDLLPQPEEEAAIEAPVLLLKAFGEAASGIATENALAVLNARFAGNVARLAAETGFGTGSGTEEITTRLAVIEAAGEALGAGLEAIGTRIARLEDMAAELTAGPARGELARSLAAVVQRLDAQSAALQAHVAREDLIAARLDELGSLVEALAEAGRAETAAAQSAIGLTLAEFLARLEPALENTAIAPRGRMAARELA